MDSGIGAAHSAWGKECAAPIPHGDIKDAADGW